MKAIAIAGLILAIAPSTAPASLLTQTVPHIQILEAGIYSATRKPSTAKPAVVANPRLIEATTSIAAAMSIRFGLRYLVLGDAQDRPVKLTMITRYPGLGVLDHATDKLVQYSDYVIEVPAGSVRYRDFIFDRRSELVAGEWIFEFWSDGKKIGEQSFCVTVPEELPPICALVLG